MEDMEAEKKFTLEDPVNGKYLVRDHHGWLVVNAAGYIAGQSYRPKVLTEREKELERLKKKKRNEARKRSRR